MSLVVLCGLPASGKSTFASALAEVLRSEKRTVKIVSASPSSAFDSTQCSVRRHLYGTSECEKLTRSNLRGEIERSLHAPTIVIVDCMNYIKGFRYELYCVAKTARASYCVVHVQSNLSDVLQRDAARESNEAYGSDLVSALAQRFEAPRATQRWDAPLHEVDVFREGFTVRVREIAETIMNGGKNALVPTIATRERAHVGADALGEIDRAARAAEMVILGKLRDDVQIGERIEIPEASRTIVMARLCRVAEIRAMRRAYISLARMHPPQDTSFKALTDGYVDYVNAQLRGAGSDTR